MRNLRLDFRSAPELTRFALIVYDDSQLVTVSPFTHESVPAPPSRLSVPLPPFRTSSPASPEIRSSPRRPGVASGVDEQGYRRGEAV